MLDELLQGEKFVEKDYPVIQTFILHLEKVFKLALDTQRAASFHLPETFAEILRSKLPHLAGKWARKEAREESYVDGIPSGVGQTFPQFISFLRENNRVAEATSTILKTKGPATTKPPALKSPISMSPTSALEPKYAEKEKPNGGGQKPSYPGSIPTQHTIKSGHGGPRCVDNCPGCFQIPAEKSWLPIPAQMFQFPVVLA